MPCNTIRRSISQDNFDKADVNWSCFFERAITLWLFGWSWFFGLKCLSGWNFGQDELSHMQKDPRNEMKETHRQTNTGLNRSKPNEGMRCSWSEEEKHRWGKWTETRKKQGEGADGRDSGNRAELINQTGHRCGGKIRPQEKEEGRRNTGKDDDRTVTKRTPCQCTVVFCCT